MKEMKIHYMPNRHKEYLQCGAVIKRNTQATSCLDAITCRVCMFSFLADAAPWAREFLDGLRKADTAAKRSVGAGAHGVPVGPATKTHGQVETLGRSLRTLLSNDAVSQKAIREFLPEPEAALATVQIVMDYSGAAAGAVGVKPSQVAERAGDAGQVSAEPNRDF